MDRHRNRQSFGSRMVGLSLLIGTFAAMGCGQKEAAPAPSASASAQGAQRYEVKVGADRYTPDRVEAKSGEPLTLVFTRTTDQGCGQQLVIASENIRKDLPLNKPVEVTFTPKAAGELRFSCGMNMYNGAIVVR